MSAVVRSPRDDAQVEPVVHGGLDRGELERRGIDPDRVLDFSTNVNPFGSLASVHRAVAEAPLGIYPDRECRRLRAVLAERHGVGVDQLVAGNGASELIHLMAAAFVRPADRVVIVTPAFGEYERAARRAGGAVEPCWVMGDATDPGRLADAAVRRVLADAPVRLLFVANPANPTGDELPPELVIRWAADWPDTLFVVDEAYAPYTNDRTSLAGGTRPNMLVLRSMTKHVALAGVRLGYVVGPEALVERIAARRPPWNVSAVAQAAGIAALAEARGPGVGIERLRGEKAFLVAGLAELGYAPRASSTPFFLLPVADAASTRGRLLGAGILVRDCTSFGLPGHVRISPLDRESNRRLLEAIPSARPPRVAAPEEPAAPQPLAMSPAAEGPAPSPAPEAPAVGAAGRHRLDPLAELAAATGLLTRLHTPGGDVARTGSAAFPVVGAVIAGLAAVPAALLAGVAPLLGAALLPAILAVVTGALHLDGLADTADALVAPTPERAEAARKDPRIGAAGAVALMLALLATVGAIAAIPGWAVVGAAAVAGAVSRAAPAVAAVVLRPAPGADTGFGAWFRAHSGPGGALAAVLGSAAITAGAAATTVLAAPSGVASSMAARAGVGGAVAGLAVGIAVAVWLNRRFGRLAGDHFGAAIELGFLASLAASAVLWGLR
ncbi:MAG: adenosylcobinamide-GDP ribazoletransferase [Candidatus Limnocylindrales bacterium]